MSGSNGRRLDATPALTALPDGAELVALVPDATRPGRKMTRRIGKAAVEGLKGDKGDPGPSGAADGIPPENLPAAAALSATDDAVVFQGGEAKSAKLGAVAAAGGLSFGSLAEAGPFSDADTVLIGQGGEAKRTTLGDLVAHVASKIGQGTQGSGTQTGTGGTGGDPPGATAPPGAVTNLTAIALSHKTARVSWGAPAGAASYAVERSPAGQNAFVSQGSGITNAGPLVFEQSDLALGASYDYRVTPSNSYGAGTPSVVTVTTLTVPGRVLDLRTGPFAATESVIYVQWDAVRDATYKVERSSDGGATFASAQSGIAQTNTAATGLTAGTARTFRVSATYDGTNYGPVSAPLTASTATAGALVLDGAGWSGKVAAAYSTRKLRSAYAGPCVRLRPSAGGAEYDVGFTASGLLDTASALAGLGGSPHGFLVKWYDQSGNGRDFVQADPARQHLAVEAGARVSFGSTNRPALRCNPFDGAWMSAPSVPVANALCAAMVAEGVAGTPYGEQGNLLIYDAGAAGITVACTPSDKTKLAAYYADGFRDYPAGDPTAGFTARARVAPDGIALSFDGTTGATLAVGSGVGATGVLHFGGQPNGGQSKSWEGLASEIVLGDGVAEADMAALDADQRAFFGV